MNQRIAMLLIILVAIVTGCVETDFVTVTPTPIPKSAPNNIPLSTPNYTSLTTPVPTTSIKADFKNSIGMEFILIPAGEFEMGSPSNDKDRFKDEIPVHRVKIENAFYLGKYEVTQKQWYDVMGTNPSYFKGDILPVEQVTWNDVQEFLKKLNEKEGTNKYRLPSEAEWEYAARAGTITIYSFGDNKSKLGEYGWYGDNAISKTHDIGQKKPNPWGLYDMYGNVWEWVQDKYYNNYSGAPTDGSAWEGVGSLQDGRLFRVKRGGCWLEYAGHSRSADHDGFDQGSPDPCSGFRIASDLKQ